MQGVDAGGGMQEAGKHGANGGRGGCGGRCKGKGTMQGMHAGGPSMNAKLEK